MPPCKEGGIIILAHTSLGEIFHLFLLKWKREWGGRKAREQESEGVPLLAGDAGESQSKYPRWVPDTAGPEEIFVI